MTRKKVNAVPISRKDKEADSGLRRLLSLISVSEKVIEPFPNT